MASLADVTVRPATPEDSGALGEFHVSAWRENYAGIVPAQMLASLSMEHRTATWHRILSGFGQAGATIVYVAEMRGQLAGFASCGPQRTGQLQALGYDGEISAIYIQKSWQRLGVGHRLMAVMATCLHESGFRAASLWVLRDNVPARRFYEQLGGLLLDEREDVRAEGVLHEVAYGWAFLGSSRRANELSL